MACINRITNRIRLYGFNKRYYRSNNTNLNNVEKNVIVISSTLFSKPTIDLLKSNSSIHNTISNNDNNNNNTNNSTSININKFGLLCPADVPRGRHNIITPLPIKQHCIDNKITTYDLPSYTTWTMNNYDLDKDIYDNYNIAVVMSFGYKIPESIINSFDIVLNIHPSLLPLYRGASPIQYALLNDDSVSGVSIIQLDEHIDSGYILLQERHSINIDDTYSVLHEYFGRVGSNMLIRVLNNLQHYVYNKKSQYDYINVLGSLYDIHKLKAPKIHKSQGLLQFNQHTAQQIYNQYRAYTGFINLYTYYNNKRVRIMKIDGIIHNVTLEDNIHNKPGSIVYDNDNNLLYVVCNDNKVVIISSVHVEYQHKPITVQHFYNYTIQNHNMQFINQPNITQ